MLKLFKFIKPYIWLAVSVLVLTFFQVITELFLPKLMSDIVDSGISYGDIPYIIKVGGVMLGVALIGTIVMIGARYFSAKVAAYFGRDLREELFIKVESLSQDKFNEVGTSSLITRTTNDINQMQQVITMMLQMMLKAPMMAIGGIIMAVSKDAKLTLILLAAMPIVILIIFLVSKKAMPLFQKMQELLDKLNLVLRERLVGMRVIRAFDQEEYESKRFNKVSGDFKSTAIKANKLMGALMPAMMFILNFTAVVFIWAGGYRIQGGNMHVGDLMALVQYVMQIMFALIAMSMMFVMIPRAMVSAKRINKVLDMVDPIKDNPDSDYKDKETGHLELRDVSFKYTGAEEPVVCDISFETKPGETTAIIGGTGSGKSTIADLIPRFHDVTTGKVLIGGVDIKDIPQQTLRQKIGYVPQHIVLFSGTVEENIRYGKQDATDEEVRHAAKIAQAEDFITDMPLGFKGYISQGGTNISGGQKQRLSIARALVRKPEIYIFDDSFSALDFKTDSILRQELEEETKKSAVITISQRVATVMDADQIIVLHEGNIVGKGTHEDLLENSEIYQEIVYSQLSKEELS